MARSRSVQREHIWLASLVVLPYASYASLIVMAWLFVTALTKRGRSAWQLCGQQGFGWLTAGLILSSSFAESRGESFLLLTNFLPFFVFFGVLGSIPGLVAQPFIKLESLARWLLLTAIPMNLWAIAEFGMKFDTVAPRVQGLPLPTWVLTRIYEPDFGHRARSVFGHPNGFSAYLVILLGLGLGLVLKGLAEQSPGQPQALSTAQAHLNTQAPSPTQKQIMNRRRWLDAIAVALCMVTIFCTGSRNGVLIAWILVAIALYAARRHFWVMMAGLVSSGVIASAVLSLGIGGRALSLDLLTKDPRIGVWKFAIDMIGQRPWLGWGFAGLRETYVSGTVPGYEMIYHAHNIWLFLASEAGIPVMLGFCAIIGTIFYGGIKTFIKGKLPYTERAILLGYLLAFASCLLFGLFDVVLFDSRLNVVTWGLIASIYVLTHHQAGQKV